MAERWRLIVDGREWGVTGGALGDVQGAVERHYRRRAVDLAALHSEERWLYRWGEWFDGNAADLAAQLDRAMPA